MRSPSVAMAVAISIAFLVPAARASEGDSKDQAAKPVVVAAQETSAGLAIAAAAASDGAKKPQIAVPGSNADAKTPGNDVKVNGNDDHGHNGDVPPGKRCDPDDPRPGCQPLPKSGKK